MIEAARSGDGRTVSIGIVPTDATQPPRPPVGAADRDSQVAAFVREHHAFVWRCLRRFGLSVADADDAAQRVFVIATERYEDIGAGSERGFLYRTAMHVASKTHRSARRRLEAADANVEEGPDDAPLPDELIDQHRARALLDRILAQLPPDLASVIVLFEIEELTTAEVAEALDVPQGTVASRLRRARAELESHVARYLARSRFKGITP